MSQTQTLQLPKTQMLEPLLPKGYTHHREFHSHSSIDLFCHCPQAYKARYIDPKLGIEHQVVENPTGPLPLGTLLHRCLELTTQELWAGGHSGRVVKEAHLYYDMLNQAFAEDPAAGAPVLTEAQEILKHWLPTELVDAQSIRGLEWPFQLILEDLEGDVGIRGYIDRLEHRGDDTVRIVDYKSSRLLFTHDELRRSRQASIYELAVRDSTVLNVHPETPVDIEFVMLRHPGINQRTTRSPEQLNQAFTEIVGLVRKIESTREFRPQLNKNCAYCEHRHACPLWRQIIDQGLPQAQIDPMDVTAVAEEYERMNNAAKILYRRKEELGDVMRTHLIGQDHIQTRNHIYRLSKTTETEFLDPHRVIQIFAKAFKQPQARIMARIGAIRKGEYDTLMKALGGRLDLQELAKVKAEMKTLMIQNPAPKLQAYKASVPESRPAGKVKRDRHTRSSRGQI